MVKYPGQCTWSSYRATAGLINCPDYLTTSWVLKHFDKKNKQSAQQKYRTFIKEGISQPSPWGELKAQILLGSEKFVASLKSHLEGKEKMIEIPKQQRKFIRPSLQDLIDNSTHQSRSKRNEIIGIAINQYGYTQSELSDYLGLHYSGATQKSSTG